MLCQACGKNTASVHVTKVINGDKSEVYLCETCAREQSEIDLPFAGKFPLHQLFTGAFGNPSSLGAGAVKKPLPGGLQCGFCGLTHAQFDQIGRFGCSNCYNAFGGALVPLFRRLHGNQQHMGKIPARAGVDVKFKKIPREVLEKKAVEQGDIKFYELASLDIKTKIAGKRLSVMLDNFIIPPDDIPEDVRTSITHWSQWIDYWAVDWNYRDDTFHNEWQSYRTKQNPTIELTAANQYEQKGTFTVLVKVIVILGNDTTKALQIEIL